MKTSALFFILSIWLGAWVALRAEEKRIPFEKAIMSPDKQHFVQLRIVDAQLNYIVTDRTSRATSYLPGIYAPVYELKWNSKSNAIVAIVHAADGTLAQIIHWNGHEWELFLVHPPIDPDIGDVRCYISDWCFRPDGIEMTDVVALSAKRREDDVNAGYYKYVFSADIATGRNSAVKVNAITRKQFLALRKFE